MHVLYCNEIVIKRMFLTCTANDIVVIMMNESRFVDCTPMPFSVQNGNPNMWIETCSAYVFQECGKFGYMDTYNSNRFSIPIVQMFD